VITTLLIRDLEAAVEDAENGLQQVAEIRAETGSGYVSGGGLPEDAGAFVAQYAPELAETEARASADLRRFHAMLDGLRCPGTFQAAGGPRLRCTRERGHSHACTFGGTPFLTVVIDGDEYLRDPVYF
jgi:hypothetical protein